jgi:K+-sensing histidine kinase KdpD
MPSTQTCPDFRVLFESAPGFCRVPAPDLRIVAIGALGRAAPTVRKTVFERFLQIGDPTTRGHGGAGLDLAHDFTQLHGGSIVADMAAAGCAPLTDEPAEHRAKRCQVSATASVLVLSQRKARMSSWSSTTSDLLDFARIESPQRQAVTVCSLVREQLARVVFPDRVRIEIDVPDDLPLPEIDPVQIGQVVLNLLVNAAQTMEHVDAAVTIFEALYTTAQQGARIG